MSPLNMQKESDSYLWLAKHVIAADNQGKNLLFSPLSIHVVLSMIAAGSNGSTRTQLLNYLKSERVENLNSLYSQIAATVFADGSHAGGPLLSANNGLWVDQSLTFKPSFRDIVYNSYKAVAQHADFQNQPEEARQEVNAWCEKETIGLIKEILPPDSITRFSRLILANTVYFKGTWKQTFNANLTTEGDFHILNGSSVRTPFMTNRNMQCVRAFDGFKVLGLSYQQGSDKRGFSMYIYLPDAKDGLPSLTERICSEPGFIDSHLPYSAVTLDEFLIPKFKIGFEFEASCVLKKLGVVDLFDMGGLTEMVEDGETLMVNRILHKAFIEVNEVGTKAAAVTVARVVLGCARQKKPQLRFVADHPFLFTITEDTSGAVLFVGQLLNPLADA
ncbi:NADH:ubiquinone reductase (H(+)-translocating) [Salvia divinorum]|uniref:NADH:ubiquinone reductase (H(+)-translocating) n=1 Tax=Salvia divinorum TaxID=28513 RepID=A0ABD1FNE5_SALDI